MDINKIEMLLRALKLGSLTKAAEEFSYTPSALSHILNSLESEINTKIIKRTYSGIEMDETKKDIIERLEKIVDLKNEILSLTGKCEVSNEFTVGTYASLSKYLLPDVTKMLHEKHPDVKINIIVADYLPDLLGEVDLIIGEEAGDENYIWQEIFKDSYVAVMHSEKHLDGNSFLQDKKYNETLILPSHSIVMSYINKDNFNDIITVKSHDDSSVLELVKSDAGISILPYASLERKDNQIKILPLYPSLERSIGIVYNKKDKNNKYIKAIKDQLFNLQ